MELLELELAFRGLSDDPDGETEENMDLDDEELDDDDDDADSPDDDKADDDDASGGMEE